MDRRIAEIRNVLDSLARVEKSDNDTKEQVYDHELARISVLDRTSILEAVKTAIGTDRQRTRYAPLVFAELYDVPGIESVFRDLLTEADSMGRASIIQIVGLRRLRNLVG